MSEPEVFRQHVARALEGDGWVADGNYSKTRDILWGHADSVVWLDYPFPLTFARLVLRTIARVRSGEELWNGNRERLAAQVFSRDSLFLWAIKTYPIYKRSIPGAARERARPSPARASLPLAASRAAMARRTRLR
jgi:adenylate kinase family enzyme